MNCSETECVRFHDASAGNTLEALKRFSDLRAEGVIRPHTTVMVGVAAFSQVREAGLTTFDRAGQVRLGSIKNHAARKAGGELYPPLDDLAEMVWQVHRPRVSGRHPCR